MYLDPEPAAIHRRFVEVEGRLVHCRTAGSGPPLLLLHQSPTSSAEMASQIVHFAQDFTVIALDTPGYGWSDPLPLQQPEIADFAHAVVDFLDALEIERAGVYGTHTGAMIAAELAVNHSGRVTAVVLDGYVVLGADERADLLSHYFAAPEPQPDGSHWPWYWARIRDQMLFFPWYRKEPATRMRFDLPSAADLQPMLLDLLRAHDNGRPAYAAAFRYDSVGRAEQFIAPTWLLNYAADAIADHPARLARLAPVARREMLPDPQALLDRASALFARHAAACEVHWPEQPERCAMVELAGSQVRLSSGGAGEGVLLLHGPGASSRQCAGVKGRARRWLSLDLPGHGASGVQVPSADALVDALTAMIAEYDVRTVVGWGESAVFAEVLAAKVPGIGVVGIAPPAQPARWPDLTPVEHGGHLLAAWQTIRDGELFDPWDCPDLAHARDREFKLCPAELHARTVDLLGAAPGLTGWRALLDEARRLPRCAAPALSADASDLAAQITAQIVLVSR